MNAHQAIQLLRARLREVAWADGAQDLVFGERGVRITAGSPELGVLLDELPLPFALVQLGASDPDEFDSRLNRQEFAIFYACSVEQDPVGEGAIIGGARPDGLGGSRGAGLLEVEQRVLEQVRRIKQSDGLTLRATRRTATGGVGIDAIGYLAYRSIVVEALLTDAASYPAPSEAAAADQTGGVARLTWTDPPSRFDLVHVRIRRAAGATPPATVSAGDAVADVAIGAETYDDDPGAGEFSYSLFAGYDDDGDGAVDSYSAAEARAQATVTVT